MLDFSDALRTGYKILLECFLPRPCPRRRAPQQMAQQQRLSAPKVLCVRTTCLLLRLRLLVSVFKGELLQNLTLECAVAQSMVTDLPSTFHEEKPSFITLCGYELAKEAVKRVRVLLFCIEVFHAILA